MSNAQLEALGHYRILSLIGEGGMGEVYLAEDTRLGRRVAVKILAESVRLDQEAKRRMLREARAVAALDHPNVCTIFEVGEHEGRPFIVMQYIEGETLFHRLEHTRPTLAECVDIGAQVAAALDQAHSRGVVHRDIKSLNIMLTPQGQVKVLDFGLAKVNSASELTTDLLMSKPGVITGTAPYMSPEQLRGVPIDGRSDIFSLGVVLYEMATGRRPFDRDNTVSTITAVLFEEPPPIEGEEFAPLVPIVRRALTKDPSKRYASAALMLRALQDIEDRPRARTRRSRSGSGEVAAAAPPPRPKSRIESVAVLPLAASELDYVVYGLSEGIVVGLSQIKKLRVIASTTVARYAGTDVDIQAAARELGVEAIVGVRARVDGEKLYVDVELISATDGSRLWGSQYMRPAREVAALAESIAADIGEQVRARGGSSSRKPVKKKRIDTEAQHLFLKGRFQWIKRHPEALKQAMTYFQQAVEQDPSFALPYAGLADAFVMLGFMQALPPLEILPKAKAAAARAIELDPHLADPHATLGYAAGLFEWDWDAACRELEEAMRLNANYPWAPHWLGLLSCGRGQTHRGLELIERAQTLDPLSPIINIAAGIPLHIARRYEDAVRRYRRVLETETAFAPGHYYIGISLQELGQFDEAIRHYERMIEIGGRNSLYLGALAHGYGRAGRTADAERVLAQITEMSQQRYMSPYCFVMAYDALGRVDDALQALEATLEERNAWMWFLPVEPRFDRLRDDPRFVAMVERHGLPVRVETDG